MSVFSAQLHKPPRYQLNLLHRVDVEEWGEHYWYPVHVHCSGLVHQLMNASYALFTVSITLDVLQDVICDSVYLAAHSGAWLLIFSITLLTWKHRFWTCLSHEGSTSWAKRQNRKWALLQILLFCELRYFSRYNDKGRVTSLSLVPTISRQSQRDKIVILLSMKTEQCFPRKIKGKVFANSLQSLTVWNKGIFPRSVSLIIQWH